MKMLRRALIVALFPMFLVGFTLAAWLVGRTREGYDDAFDLFKHVWRQI